MPLLREATSCGRNSLQKKPLYSLGWFFLPNRRTRYALCIPRETQMLRYVHGTMPWWGGKRPSHQRRGQCCPLFPLHPGLSRCPTNCIHQDKRTDHVPGSHCLPSFDPELPGSADCPREPELSVRSTRSHRLDSPGFLFPDTPHGPARDGLRALPEQLLASTLSNRPPLPLREVARRPALLRNNKENASQLLVPQRRSL